MNIDIKYYEAKLPVFFPVLLPLSNKKNDVSISCDKKHDISLSNDKTNDTRSSPLNRVNESSTGKISFSISVLVTVTIIN